MPPVNVNALPVMKYAIIHMMKHTRYAVTGMQIHNRREKESHTNKDIRRDKTHLNYHIKGGEGSYLSLIDKRLNEIPKPDKKYRSDAIYAAEFIITASPEYMATLTEGEKKRYFRTAVEFIENRYGKENTLWASVHNDEANPHMHCGIIPIKENRLSAKALFPKSELTGIQDSFYAYMNDYGFTVERGGTDTKNKHLSKDEYIIEKKRAEIASKHSKIEEEEKIIGKYAEKIENVKNGAFLTDSGDILRLEKWRVEISGRKPGMFGKVSFSPEERDKMVRYMMTGIDFLRVFKEAEQREERAKEQWEKKYKQLEDAYREKLKDSKEHTALFKHTEELLKTLNSKLLNENTELKKLAALARYVNMRYPEIGEEYQQKNEQEEKKLKRIPGMTL
jgi:hypothetical protein